MISPFRGLGSNQQIGVVFVTLPVLLAYGLVLGGWLQGSTWLYAILPFVATGLATVTGMSTVIKRAQASQATQTPPEQP